MCGRFALDTNTKALKEQFGVHPLASALWISRLAKNSV